MNLDSDRDPSPGEPEVSGFPTPDFLTQTRFDSFDLPPEVLAGLKDAGFSHCTPIQAKTIPVLLEGHDVAGQAQTGTGKTAAFMVAVLTRMLRLTDRDPAFPSALIVAPTRELALQIYDDARVLGGHTGFRLAQVVGGIDYLKQASVLKQGADIVICTPGRVIDYLKQGVLKTNRISTLVIDEADRLFDLGFTRDMRYLLRRLPRYDQRQSMLFSATLSYRVMELTYEYMNLPQVISVEAEDLAVEGVEQTLFHVGSKEKLSLLLGLLEREDWSRVLIFINTKSGVDWLAKKLRGNGYPAQGISGDLPQRKRLSLMKQYKEGELKILVATDVASRGIHVEDISHVINYDLPQDPENYVHRIGRTARAGKTGKAFAFACENYVLHLEPLEKLLGYKIPVTWPGDAWFLEDCARAVERYRPKGKRGDGGGKPPRRRSGPRRADSKPEQEAAPRAEAPLDRGSEGVEEKPTKADKETPRPPREPVPSREDREEAPAQASPSPEPAQVPEPKGKDRSRRPEVKKAGTGKAGKSAKPKAAPLGGVFGLGRGPVMLGQPLPRLEVQQEREEAGEETPPAKPKRRRSRRRKPKPKPQAPETSDPGQQD